MSLINIQNLTFGYDGSFENVFEDVSLQLDTDYRLGFIGRNGRGKTTFLKLLLGELSGRGSINADVRFEYFPFSGYDEEDTALSIVENISGRELWEIERELSLLNMDEEVLYRPFYTLSGGEKTRLLLMALFLKEGGFLLIDEPTNHLDTGARDALSKYLKSKKGFILVSHDRAFLDGCVSHTLSINNADIELMKGNFSTWRQNRDYKDGFEIAKNEKLKKDIKRLDAAAKRSTEWSHKAEKGKHVTKDSDGKPDRGYVGHMAAKMMKRAKSTETRRERAADEKSGLMKNVETADELFLQPLTYHSDRVAEVSGLSIVYDGRVVISGLGFDIRQGERILLKGRNGSGKSSVLKLLAGGDIPHTGEARLMSRVKISYVPQDTSFLSGSMDSLVRSAGIDESLYKAILRKMGFNREQFGKDLSDLSEGQKKKALIAKSLCEQAHLYIWDEPLNYIDIISRMQIEEAILRSSPTMLFVEHDIAFAANVATKVVGL